MVLSNYKIPSTWNTKVSSSFEAAWAGDLEKIKSFTLTPWGSDQREPPLKIAVSDAVNNNPFSLAFVGGHFETAKAILDIVQAQWSPTEEAKARFKMVTPEDDEESCEESDTNDGDSEPEIYKEIINDQFTIENIGQVSMQVRSDVLPSSILNWAAPTFEVHSDKAGETNFACQNLLTHMIWQNDTHRFTQLLDLNARFASNQPDDGDDEKSKIYTVSVNEFENAISKGRTHMLAEVIRRFGAGIPLEDLVKKSGVEMKTKARYYQGLTVYGKKRADWARAGRNLVVRPTGNKLPPLLSAAFKGSLESVEWFLGDAPLRHYREFGTSKVAKEDPRLKHLNEAPGGFDRAITKWLGMQSKLIPFSSVSFANSYR